MTTTLLDKVGIKTNGLSSVHVLFVINVCPNFIDSLICPYDFYTENTFTGWVCMPLYYYLISIYDSKTP